MSRPQELSRETIVAFLEDIFECRGSEAYLGEPVTMAEHMLQGATLAERAGQDETIVVAALLHKVAGSRSTQRGKRDYSDGLLTSGRCFSTASSVSRSTGLPSTPSGPRTPWWVPR